MTDIFKLFNVATKEDAYTFCLYEMIKTGPDTFKERVGKEFGFCDSNFTPFRGTIQLEEETDNKLEEETDNNRKQITPDLILYNKNRIAVIESKMFSSEGYNQTMDYYKHKVRIKQLLEDKTSVSFSDKVDYSFYYLSLSGQKPTNNNFTTIKWDDFYKSIFNGEDTLFENDESLELIRKTILKQANAYKEFKKDMKNKKYGDLFNNEENYWITPLTLFSDGAFDEEWQKIISDEKIEIWHGFVNGKGHSEFTTNIKNGKWKIKGKNAYDNIHLFIRIEGNRQTPIIWLCWEYWEYDKNGEVQYMPTNKLKNHFNDEEYESAINNLKNYKMNYKNKYQTTSKSNNSLKALKCKLQINDELMISEVMKDIKEVVNDYKKEIKTIVASFNTKHSPLLFEVAKYNEKMNNI